MKMLILDEPEEGIIAEVPMFTERTIVIVTTRHLHNIDGNFLAHQPKALLQPGPKCLCPSSGIPRSHRRQEHLLML